MCSDAFVIKLNTILYIKTMLAVLMNNSICQKPKKKTV